MSIKTWRTSWEDIEANGMGDEEEDDDDDETEEDDDDESEI
jgi:hypothetical protein